jgi:tetratricopeptide (TPR) repeat protein
MIQADPGNAELYFYMGSAYGYMGIHQSRKKSWFSAFTNGIKGVKALQKCIRLDSTYYDAYMAVGTYKYWRSRMTQFLFWLPFVSDERAEGIRLIKTGAEKGTFSTYVSVNNLAWIDLDAGKYQEAIDWAKKGADRFPTSRFFMWVWGYAAERAGKMEEAKTIFEKILFSVQKESFNNHYNEIECHFKLAEINNSLHRPEEACQHLTEIKKLDPDVNIRRRLQNRLIKTELLLKNCPN